MSGDKELRACIHQRSSHWSRQNQNGSRWIRRQKTSCNWLQCMQHRRNNYIAVLIYCDIILHLYQVANTCTFLVESLTLSIQSSFKACPGRLAYSTGVVF